ncbi:hypothetical protein LguiB_019000 [Lonicera macranthoides]
MIKAQLRFGMINDTGVTTDQSNANVCRSITKSSFHSSCSFSFRLSCRQTSSNCRSKSILITCKSSRRRFRPEYYDSESEDDYFEAFVLVSETVRHHRMLIKGFQEKVKWKPSGQKIRFPVLGEHPTADMDSLGPDLLRTFRNPTIFLKICCDGDFVLPIVVGEFVVEKLIDSLHEDEDGDFPSQFQLVRNIVTKLGYEVKMVRITQRVVHTYFARIFFHKPGEKEILEVDVRPSDAINVARRCKVPLFVNKQIVLTDAIRTGNGMRRMRDSNIVYDASLDSAADGPDLLTEELDMARNMNLAIKEERYGDAAMWRDKLMKLRESRDGL